MARGDNRRGKKIVQRHGQAKKKARLRRQAEAKRVARQSKPRTAASASAATRKTAK